MASKKKTPSDAPAAPAKFPARARKKSALAEVAPPPEEAMPVAVAAPVEVTPLVVVDTAVAVEPVEPTQEAIRAHAYALWRAEGGSAQANWLRAEAELRGR